MKKKKTVGKAGTTQKSISLSCGRIRTECIRIWFMITVFEFRSIRKKSIADCPFLDNLYSRQISRVAYD